MKKCIIGRCILFVGLSTFGAAFMNNATASDIGYTVSAELVCKTSKNGKSMVVVSGGGNYIGIPSGAGNSIPVSSMFGSSSEGSRFNVHSQSDFDRTEIPCTAAKAVIDTTGLINFCANALSVNASLVLFSATGVSGGALIIGGAATLTTQPTSSVSLGNGLVVYNWDATCLAGLPR